MPDTTTSPLDLPEEILALRQGWVTDWVVYTNCALEQFIIHKNHQPRRIAAQAFGAGDANRYKYIEFQRPVAAFMVAAIEHLRKQDWGPLTLSELEKRMRNAEVVRTNILDVFNPETGEITHEKGHLIRKITTTETKFGRNLSVELYSASEAIQIDNKMAGHDSGIELTVKQETRTDQERLQEFVEDMRSPLFAAEMARQQPEVLEALKAVLTSLPPPDSR